MSLAEQRLNADHSTLALEVRSIVRCVQYGYSTHELLARCREQTRIPLFRRNRNKYLAWKTNSSMIDTTCQSI